MPFFFDLTSLMPSVERNPFAPVLIPDAVPGVEASGAELASGPEVDADPGLGLPIPTHYDFDLMRALVQDPFRLYVYWNLRENTFDRVRRIFPESEAETFRLALRLIDETNNIAVFFDVPYTREYWFTVFPDRSYRVEMGLRSPRHGYIRLMSSQSVRTPRGGPSEVAAPEPEYMITADEYLTVLRESHLIPERAYEPDGLLRSMGIELPGGAEAVLERLPPSFRRLMGAIGDIQAGREYDRWWERLDREELAELVREFLCIIREMGDGETGYILMMRYLPELLRRAIRAEEGEELRVDKPVALFLAERLGQSSSEQGRHSAGEREADSGAGPSAWMPSQRR